MKSRFYLALWAGKCASLALKITKHQGTDFPGNLALRLCPDFAAHIAKPKTIIGITGTNGKTTTTNLIADLLEKDGQKIMCNRLGSNCLSGILTCLIHGATLTGKQQYQTAVLEIDERSARTIFPHIHPDYLLINNLTRDSIMRNGHPEYICWILTRYMPEKTKLIINADDLIAIQTAPKNNRCYFGVDRLNSDTCDSMNLTNDMRICPICHSKLTYDFVRYHHIGKAHCPNCDFASPDLDYRGYDVDRENLSIEIAHHGQNVVFPLISHSIHDIYNVVAATALLGEMGLDLNKTADLMQDAKIVATRYDMLNPKPGYRVIRQMSKGINAVATTRAFDYVAHQPGKKEIIMLIFNHDDDVMWSENICWMQDCDFEFLNDPNITNIVCTGPRAADWILRMTMAGISKEKITIIEDRWQAAKGLKLESPEDVYVLFGADSIDMSVTVAKNAAHEILDRSL